MKPIRFVHASDAHLGYMQYNLLERQEDFLKAFEEFIENTKELSPDFVIFAGDLFNDPHPSNLVLSSAIDQIDSLKIPFLVVPGSHDNIYSALVGTVLDPLHRGRHIHYLPVKPYKHENIYVYGMTNFRRRADFEKARDEYFKARPPEPKEKYNIFVLHQGVDFPKLNLHPNEVEILPGELPKGFQYYAAGHLHVPVDFKFDNGIFAYSGSLETFEYTQYPHGKGFYLVEVDADGETSIKRVNLACYRKFNIIEEDFTGLKLPEIEEKATRLVLKADEKGAILVLVLTGTLPHGASRADINYDSLKTAASKALYVHIVNKLKTPEETTGPIAIAGAETIFSRAGKKLSEYYKDQFQEQASKYADFTVELVKILADKAMKSKERKNTAETKIDEFYGIKKEEARKK